MAKKEEFPQGHRYDSGMGVCRPLPNFRASPPPPRAITSTVAMTKGSNYTAPLK
ncbi:MAG: hypothetical protein GXP25_11790 [Planctomycetes bacterium]|nr:hypothetical protein [Planctomycetota bacterium]